MHNFYRLNDESNSAKSSAVMQNYGIYITCSGLENLFFLLFFLSKEQKPFGSSMHLSRKFNSYALIVKSSKSKF